MTLQSWLYRRIMHILQSTTVWVDCQLNTSGELLSNLTKLMSTVIERKNQKRNKEFNWLEKCQLKSFLLIKCWDMGLRVVFQRLRRSQGWSLGMMGSRKVISITMLKWDVMIKHRNHLVLSLVLLRALKCYIERILSRKREQLLLVPNICVPRLLPLVLF